MRAGFSSPQTLAMESSHYIFHHTLFSWLLSERLSWYILKYSSGSSEMFTECIISVFVSFALKQSSAILFTLRFSAGCKDDCWYTQVAHQQCFVHYHHCSSRVVRKQPNATWFTFRFSVDCKDNLWAVMKIIAKIMMRAVRKMIAKIMRAIMRIIHIGSTSIHQCSTQSNDLLESKTSNALQLYVMNSLYSYVMVIIQIGVSTSIHQTIYLNGDECTVCTASFRL